MRIIPRQSIAQVPHLSLCVFTLVCIPLALTTDGESSFRKSEDGSEILFLVIVFLFTTDSLHSLSLVSGLFYDAILEPLGYSRVFEDLRPGEMHKAIGYSVVPDEDVFAVKVRSSEYLSPGSGFHLAFSAPSRESIDVWHKQGIEMGAKDKGAPKIWTDFGPNYYVAYLTNLDGWQIGAVFKTIQ